MAAPALLTGPARAEEKRIGERLKDAVTGASKVEITPPEDLMREHGVLDRVLLVYEAGLSKFATGADFDPALITRAGAIVRDFIHDYHEQSEEQQVFPRFRAAGRMTDLVDVLERQHEAGRKVTETIVRLAPTSRNHAEDRRRLLVAIQSFITMYRPHAAREDTDLFPRLKDVVSSHEYDALAEDFEKAEHARFGEDGFGKMTARVAALEQALGISDLDQFTPHPD